jgi:hypothetical protein
MPWFKVDDKLHDHRKARAAQKAAMGVWVLAGSWSSDNLTDGFVPESVLNRWGNRADARRLVDVGLWVEAVQDGERGWRFHEWDERQPSRASVEVERSEARQRMAELRAKRKANKKNGSGEQPPNDSGTSGEVRSAPTRPDPTTSSYVVGESVDSSPDVPREDDHDVRAEPRSGAVDPRSSAIAREYWGRVPLCDKAKVSNVVFAAKQAGYEERDIRRGLRTLAKESRPVTPDTLRIAIEGKTPAAAAAPRRTVGREGW